MLSKIDPKELKVEIQVDTCKPMCISVFSQKAETSQFAEKKKCKELLPSEKGLTIKRGRENSKQYTNS